MDNNRTYDKLTGALPEDETQRQYYFIEAAREKLRLISEDLKRPLTYHGDNLRLPDECQGFREALRDSGRNRIHPL